MLLLELLVLIMCFALVYVLTATRWKGMESIFFRDIFIMVASPVSLFLLFRYCHLNFFFAIAVSTLIETLLMRVVRRNEPGEAVLFAVTHHTLSLCLFIIITLVVGPFYLAVHRSLFFSLMEHRQCKARFFTLPAYGGDIMEFLVEYR